MPYLNCQGCGLTIYSAATYATTDDCPRCGTPLHAVRRLPRLEAAGVVQQAGAARAASPGRVSVRSTDMEIDVRTAAFGTHVEVRGQFMYPLAARLDSALDQIERFGRTLVLDLRGITDLDSSGLASVMAAYVRTRREGVELLVVSPPAPYRRILELTGVDRRLTLVDDLDAASARASSP
jgi:anti-sigma B factor antagonist